MNEQRKVLVDLASKRFGKLLVLKRAENKGKAVMWLCKCDCGNELSIRGSHLKSGQIQCSKCVSHATNIKDVLFSHPNHTIWVMMKQRCENKNAVGYKNYGGRGIKVCERWQKFKNFMLDMGNRPSDKHTLDRINVNEDYCPSNCKWSTYKEQQRNTRNNRIISHEGKNLTVAEWSELTGIAYGIIHGRLKLGWSVKDALTKKPRQSERVVEFNGVKLTMKEWSKKLGIPKQSLDQRYYKGYTLKNVFYKGKHNTRACLTK